MKNKTLKILSATLSVTVLLSSLSAGILAQNSTETSKKATADTKVAATATENDKCEKDETVYVLAGADGSVEKIIVSDWIKNSVANAKLNDKSELTNIENVKGDESYTLNKDNMKVWDANGKDIYYNGNIEKELPVDLSVSYKLNGKSISPKELLGKSGKCTIRFDYKNNQYENVTVDGKKEKIYVPFVMLTGMLLDNDNFKNVDVLNGKIINDGDRTAVLGVAFPGLSDNLNLNSSDYSIPDYIEITADVENFTLGNTVTIATNEVFSAVDTSKFDSLDSIADKADALSSGMNKLLNGSSSLYNGLNTLLSKTDTLISGVDAIYNGLSEISSHSSELNAGADTVYGSILSTVENQIKANNITIDSLTKDNYKTVLNGLINNPTETQQKQLVSIASAKINDTLKAKGVPEDQYDTVKYMLYVYGKQGKTTEEAFPEISKLLTSAGTVQKVPNLTAGNPALYNAVLAQVKVPAVAERITSVAIYLASTKGGDAQNYVSAAQTMVTEASQYSQYAAEASTAQGKAAINGLMLNLAKQTLKPQIDSALDQLNKYNQFYEGILSYTAGVEKVTQGTKELKSNLPALKEGVGELTSGSLKLSDGLKELNNQGLEKIVSLVKGDLASVVTRLKATVDVSKDYKSFSGISDDMDGKVKFVYRTSAIE